MPGLNRTDPYGGYMFKVELGGVIQAQFKTCAGLDSARSAVKYREGTETSLASRQLGGLVNVTNITLAHGITSESSLWDWYNDVANGKIARRDIAIVLFDDLQNERIRWTVKNAWPTKWSGPSFDATSDAIAIETLELVHEGVEKTSWK
ncbi:MAG TPA: phage tail protein [Polyangia bacterium]|nr:phage tail protein [Polyangia bacterium]